MPGMGEYMVSQQGAGGGAPASSGTASLGNMGSQMMQPNYGSQEAEATPLNDRVYNGGEMTQFWKRLLLERQQARAAASAQYQRGQLEQNRGVSEGQGLGMPAPPQPMPGQM